MYYCGMHSSPPSLLEYRLRNITACLCKSYPDGKQRRRRGSTPWVLIKSIHSKQPRRSKAWPNEQCNHSYAFCQYNSCNANPLHAFSQALSYPLRQLPLSKLPRVQEPLLGEVEVLHRCHVLCGRPAHTGGHRDGISLQDDTVVYQLVDGKGLRVLVVGSAHQHR